MTRRSHVSLLRAKVVALDGKRRDLRLSKDKYMIPAGDQLRSEHSDPSSIGAVHVSSHMGVAAGDVNLTWRATYPSVALNGNSH